MPASRPANPACDKPTPRIAGPLNAAIDRTMAERPELFDFKDLNGGPRLLDYKAYTPPSGNWVIRKYVGACSPATS